MRPSQAIDVISSIVAEVQALETTPAAAINRIAIAIDNITTEEN